MKDVGAPLAVVRADERITKAQLPGQGRRFRLFGKETVRPCFDDETLKVPCESLLLTSFARSASLPPARRLGAGQSVRRSQPCYASTEDRYALSKLPSGRPPRPSPGLRLNSERSRREGLPLFSAFSPKRSVTIVCGTAGHRSTTRSGVPSRPHLPRTSRKKIYRLWLKKGYSTSLANGTPPEPAAHLDRPTGFPESGTCAFMGLRGQLIDERFHGRGDPRFRQSFPGSEKPRLISSIAFATWRSRFLTCWG